MPRTRAQRLRETMEEDGWAGMPEELFEKVLELLQPDGPSKPQDGGLGFTQTLAAVRLVCAGWKAVHDAMVTRLLLRRETTDEAVGMLVRRFPTVVSLEIVGVPGQTAALTDKGLRAVSSLPSLTFLGLNRCRTVTGAGMRALSSCTSLTSLDLTWCEMMTDEGLRSVSKCTALKSLNLYMCRQVTDKGVRAVSSCTALTYLDITGSNVTDESLRAVSNCTALTELSLEYCRQLTDAGVRALSSLPALTELDLRYCYKVTAAGVQALRSTTAAPNLRITR
jgi:hypothetical protein